MKLDKKRKTTLPILSDESTTPFVFVFLLFGFGHAFVFFAIIALTIAFLWIDPYIAIEHPFWRTFVSFAITLVGEFLFVLVATTLAFKRCRMEKNK